MNTPDTKSERPYQWYNNHTYTKCQTGPLIRKNTVWSVIERFVVSIRPTTGIKPLYTTIATVTMNLIVSAAIVLLNPYVTIYISYKIPPFALSVHIPDVSASTCVEADPKVSHELHSCDKAFGRLHHSGNSLGLHRVPYK